MNSDSARGGPSPLAAGLLSSLVPGLGQVAAGSRARGLGFALAAAMIVVVLVAVLLGQDGLLDALVSPDVLATILVLNVALGTVRFAAIVDAWRLVARRRAGLNAPGRRATLALAILLASTIAVHGTIEGLAFEGRETVQAVFVAARDGWTLPESSFEPKATPAAPTGSPTASAPTASAPAATPAPTLLPSASLAAESPEATATALPSPTPKLGPAWAADDRLNLLLIGSDAGPDRWSLRTDTVIVLSIDVATARAALFGIPRNMVGVPLPPESAGAFRNGQYPGLLNSLYVYAMGHPAQFPGGNARGFRAVAGSIQELVGVPIDGVIVVNLRGFVQLVDAIGGLWIDIRERLVDANYPLEDGSGSITLNFRLGCQRLSGRMALAYSRSRHQDSDYGRMRRQQAVLAALARQVEPMALVPKFPELLGIARQNIWTTLDGGDLGGLARLAARVSVDRLQTVRFVPSRYPERLDGAAIEKIRSVVRTIFDAAPPARRPDLPGTCP